MRQVLWEQPQGNVLSATFSDCARVSTHIGVDRRRNNKRRDDLAHQPPEKVSAIGRTRGESISQLSSVSTASLSSSYIMLDKDSAAEDVGVQIRQRRGRDVEGSRGLEEGSE